MAKAYRLKLKKLDFISAVDAGAQGPISNVALIKRDDRDGLDATFRVFKVDEPLGLVFGWALATSLDGGETPHVDLQNDAITNEDLIKVAAAFMEDAAASDVMHDDKPDGKIVFAMPLVPEVNQALGITSKTHGLAIAMKPSAETFKRFQSGELAAFSIAGTGMREPLDQAKRANDGRVCKANLYTDEIDGHQHQIHCYEDGTFWVQHATAEGAEQSHSHGIVFEDGKLTILADSGHSHELADGQPGIAVVPADAIVIVAARAPQLAHAMRAPNNKSTTANRVPTVDAHTEKSKMNELDTLKQTLSDLTKRNDRAERIAKMSGAHKTHFDTLTADDADAFLAKSASEREAIVKAARDADAALGEVVYTSLAGETFTKRDDARLVAAVKRADEAEKARETESIAKRTRETLGQLGGSDATRELIVRAVIKSGAPQADIDAALTAMKAWAAESSVGKRAPGANPGEDAPNVGPQGDFDALVTKHAADHKVDLGSARLAVIKTEQGRALYNQIELQKKQRAHA